MTYAPAKFEVTTYNRLGGDAILEGGGGNVKDGKDQEMIQSSTTPDPGYHMGK